MEQTSLFAEEEAARRLPVWSCRYCNDDWSGRTKTVGNCNDIIDSFRLITTKEELKQICRRAVNIKKSGPYGYRVRYIDDGVKKEIFIRYQNYPASKRRSVYEHIDLYFDQEWEWLNARGLLKEEEE
ncbi:PcfU [Enterococcus hirae]|nr:PcfU [Enterococcus hirae]